MKTKTLLSILFLLTFGALHSQNVLNKTITCTLEDASIKEFTQNIEESCDVRFFYDTTGMMECSITINERNKRLEEILSSAIFSTPYTYYQLSNNIICLVPKNSFVSPLPKYSLLRSTIEPQEEVEQNQYLSGRRSDIKKAFVIGDHRSYAEKVVVKGHITDKTTEEPLIGATLYLREQAIGIASDIYGNVEFEVPPGKYNVEFRSVGMVTENYFFEVKSEGEFSLAMEESTQTLEEVVISGKKSYGNRTENMGEDKLEMKKVQKLPTLTGEVDIVSISKMLPGIVSVSEGTGGVNVRGGGADQNIFYLNNIPVYNTSHAFGFFPAINSAIVDEFSIYKSYIPIQFGGRLSSIFDVSSKSGNKNNFFAQGNLGLITTDLAAEGPIIKNKLSYVASARASYSDWILKQLPDENLQNSNMRFYDLSALLNYQINKDNEVEITTYNSYDYFSNAGVNKYDYSNFGIGANYRHRFNSKLNSEFSFSFSEYSFQNTDMLSDLSAFTQNYSIEHAEFRGMLNYLYKEKHVFQGGFSSTLLGLDRGNLQPYGDASLYVPLELGKETGIENVLFFQDSYNLTNRLTVKGGVRFSFFTQLGPETVYEYEPGRELTDINIIDTLHFDKNEVVTNYGGPGFRFAADYKLSSNNSLKFSFTQMRQYMFLLSNTYAITPIDQWKMADYHLKPSKQWQVSTGFYQDIPSWRSSFIAEVYYKKADNIVELKDGADLVSTPNLETVTLQGEQESYGVELMLSKNTGILTGWTSYTYSRSLMQIDGDSYWNKINGGRQYASNYDKPHVLNVVANLQLSRRFNLASNLVYSTGRPITYPMSSYIYDDIKYVEFSDRNAYRVPDYFRLDMSLTIDGNLKANKMAHSKWVISVYNLTGRSNPYSIYFKNDQGSIQGYKYSLIGVPVFSISWKFKLGNYLSE